MIEALLHSCVLRKFNPPFVMSKNICPVTHDIYVKGQEEILNNPFPLNTEKGYSIKTIGGGDGLSPLLNTVDRFCNQYEGDAVAIYNVHPFSRTADKRLSDLLLMDYTALKILLLDPQQNFLRKVNKIYKTSRVEARFTVCCSDDHVQTIGAVRSATTERWFAARFDYYRGQSRKHKPYMLTFLPPVAS